MKILSPVLQCITHREEVCMAFFFVLGYFLYYAVIAHVSHSDYGMFVKSLTGLRIFVVLMSSFASIGLYAFLEGIASWMA